MSLHYVITNEPCTNIFSITNTTGAPNYMKLKDTILNTMSWKPVINMKGSILPSGDDVLVHDICKYIPTNGNCSFPPVFPRFESSFMFDPTIYKGPQAYDQLKKDIIASFKEAGFKGSSTKQSFNGKSSKSRLSRQAQLEMICNCGKDSILELKNKGHDIKYRTSRSSTINSKCTFRLQVACASNNQWYLIHSGDDSGKQCIA